MSPPMRILLALLCLGTLLQARAGTPATARLESRLEAPEKTWVGQRVNLQVTLYTSGTFSGVPRFELPEDPGMLVLGDDGRPVLGSVTIDGTDYLSKRYSIALFPLRSGTLVVPAFQVEFSWRDADRRERTATLSTTAQRLTVLPVPGADPSRPLLTSTRLTLEDRWEPRPGKARVGDAFTRTVILTAEGVPGMALPPFEPSPPEGVGLYPETPRVGTDTERGAFLGRRQERYSYVFEQPGSYRLPPVSVQWWNPRSEVLQTLESKPVRFEVAPNPLLQSRPSGTAAAGESTTLRGWHAAIALAAAAGLLLWWRKRRLGRRKDVRRRQRAACRYCLEELNPSGDD